MRRPDAATTTLGGSTLAIAPSYGSGYPAFRMTRSLWLTPFTSSVCSYTDESYQSLKMPHPPRTVHLDGAQVKPTRGARLSLSPSVFCSSCRRPRLNESFFEIVQSSCAYTPS